MNDTTTALATSVERGTLKARDIAVGPTGVHFTNFGEMLAYANAMADGDVGIPPFMRNKPGLCLVVLRDAMRFGLNEFALARESYAVSGQLAYMAKAINAMVLSAVPMRNLPKYEYAGTSKVVEKIDDDGKKRRRREGDLMCTVTVTLATGEVITHTSPEIGAILVQNSPLWIADERQQLGYFTMRALARLNLPHVMMGLYTPEERAAETAVDITPPRQDRPTVAASLTGQPRDEGFSEHTVAAGMAVIAEAVEDKIGMEVDVDPAEQDDPTLDDLMAALTEAMTAGEVDMVEAEFAQAIADAPADLGAKMGDAIRDRRAKLKPRKGKTPAGELPLK